MEKIFLNALIVSLLSVGALQAQPLVIMHTNDTHSQIDPYSKNEDVNVGGFLRRDAAIREIRAQNPNTLLLDAGDFSQGTPYFNFFKGYVEVQLMNDMGYDAATLGNHEFDNGSAALAARLKKADFPIVCANYEFVNKKLAKIVKPYVILERGGMKIGIFGLGVNLEGYIAPQIANEVVYLDPFICARNTVEELRQQQCNLVICLSHIGTDTNIVDNDIELARQVPDIDVIVGGHSHKPIDTLVNNGHTYILQLKDKGKDIGVLTVE